MKFEDMTLKDLEREYITSDVYRELLNIDEVEIVTVENLKKWAKAKKALLVAELDNLKELVCPKCGRDKCGTEIGIDELEHTIKWIEVNLEGKV